LGFDFLKTEHELKRHRLTDLHVSEVFFYDEIEESVFFLYEGISSTVK